MHARQKKSGRRHDNDHLAFIRFLPCLACGDNTATEAAHVRMSDARIGKVNPGVGQKPHDCFTVPLCGRCHREQHTANEFKWWQARSIDPILISLALYSVSGDYDAATKIITAALRV